MSTGFVHSVEVGSFVDGPGTRFVGGQAFAGGLFSRGLWRAQLGLGGVALLIVPQHFGTYREDDENRFWTKGYPDELRLALSADLQKRYRKLAIGEKLVIP